MTSRPEASAVNLGGFVRDDTPTEEVDRREAVLESLAGTVRELIDATIRTTVADDEVHRVRDDLAALVDRLRAAQLPGPAGAGTTPNSAPGTGAMPRWAPRTRSPRRSASSTARRDATPTSSSAQRTRDPRTGARRGLRDAPRPHHGSDRLRDAPDDLHRDAHHALPARHPPGPLRLEASIAREEGRKVFVVASISDADGVTVEADGVFIQLPGHRETGDSPPLSHRGRYVLDRRARTEGSMMRSFADGSVAVVTGSSRGIGFEVARALANAGASVVINGRDQAALDDAVSTLGTSARVAGVAHPPRTPMSSAHCSTRHWSSGHPTSSSTARAPPNPPRPPSWTSPWRTGARSSTCTSTRPS